CAHPRLGEQTPDAPRLLHLPGEPRFSGRLPAARAGPTRRPFIPTVHLLTRGTPAPAPGDGHLDLHAIPLAAPDISHAAPRPVRSGAPCQRRAPAAVL